MRGVTWWIKETW